MAAPQAMAGQAANTGSGQTIGSAGAAAAGIPASRFRSFQERTGRRGQSEVRLE